jgi:hypothetical protein
MRDKPKYIVQRMGVSIFITRTIRLGLTEASMMEVYDVVFTTYTWHDTVTDVNTTLTS